MEIQQLEHLTREYIKDIYKAEYKGKLHIEKLQPQGYCITFGMQIPEKPCTIYAELDDEAFKKFLRKELNARRSTWLAYGVLKLQLPFDPHKRDTSCKTCSCTNDN